MSALALGLPLLWGPVRCSRAARAPLLRCPQFNPRAAPAARGLSAVALGLQLHWALNSCAAYAARSLVRHVGSFTCASGRMVRISKIEIMGMKRMKRKKSVLKRPSVPRKVATSQMVG